MGNIEYFTKFSPPKIGVIAHLFRKHWMRDGACFESQSPSFIRRANAYIRFEIDEITQMMIKTSNVIFNTLAADDLTKLTPSHSSSGLHSSIKWPTNKEKLSKPHSVS